MRFNISMVKNKLLIYIQQIIYYVLFKEHVIIESYILLKSYSDMTNIIVHNNNKNLFIFY